MRLAGSRTYTANTTSIPTKKSTSTTTSYSSSSSSSSANDCHVEIESVLRLRPFLKKERDDAIILEPDRKPVRNTPPTVILQPLHNGSSTHGGMTHHHHRKRDHHNNSNDGSGPSEYHFNHVLPCDTSQDKIYYKLGLPIATTAMSSLQQSRHRRTGGTTKSKTHLIICTGVTNSGKTYTCFGGTSIPKRRSPQDGLVPRFIDSLFSQSKHNGSKGFAIKISMVQVAQSKGNDIRACQVQDLLNTSNSSSSSSSSNKNSNNGTSSSNKGKQPSPTRLNLKTVRNMAAKFEKVVSSPVKRMSPTNSKSSRNIESNVDVEDFKPSTQSCVDVSQAREILQSGLAAGRKAAKSYKNYHILITIQPVINGSDYGDKIAILDMAGLEQGKSNKRGHRGGKEDVTTINQAANAAVLHCLRTLIHNNNVRNGTANDTLDVEDDDLASELSCVSQEKHQNQHSKSYHSRLKPVPFQQHNLTRLLNPLFTASSSTKVMLLVTAYPGHADYYEKKAILQDMELLCGAALFSSTATAQTGFHKKSSSQGERTVTTSLNHNNNIREEPRSPYSKKKYNEEEKYEPSVTKEPLYNIPKVIKPSNMLKTEPSAISLDFSCKGQRDHENLELDNDGVSRPPPSAPTFNTEQQHSLVSTAPTETSVYPSAPNKDTTRRPSLEVPSKSPIYHSPKAASSKVLDFTKNVNSKVLDFPGVPLPSKTQCISPIDERRKVLSVIPSYTTGGPNHKAPPSPENLFHKGLEAPSYNSERTKFEGSRVKAAANNNTFDMTNQQTQIAPSVSLRSRTDGLKPVAPPSPKEQHHSRLKPVAPPSPKEQYRSRQAQASDFPNIRGPRSSTEFKQSMSPDFQKRALQPSSKANASRSPNPKTTAFKEKEVNRNRAPQVGQVIGESRRKNQEKQINTYSVTPVRRNDDQSYYEGRRSSVASENKENFVGSNNNQLQQDVIALEQKMNQLMKENEALKARCEGFEQENSHLKSAVQKANRRLQQNQWMEPDEDEFQKQKRLRHKQQALFQPEVFNHLKDVNHIYDLKNQWCMSNKPHFNLSFPTTFQRAPALDDRDRKKEEKEAIIAESASGRADVLSGFHSVAKQMSSFSVQPTKATTTQPVSFVGGSQPKEEQKVDENLSSQFNPSSTKTSRKTPLRRRKSRAEEQIRESFAKWKNTMGETGNQHVLF